MAKDQNQVAIPLTPEQEVEKVFSKFDTNGDGRISSTELQSILKGVGSATSAEEARRIMSELDVDGDGFIDLNEFKAFHLGGGGGSDEELKEAFDVYDKDNNGKITAVELHSVLRSLGDEWSVNDCQNMISAVDGDGCVNFEEFKRMMTRAA